MKSTAGQAAAARRTHTPSKAARAEMDNFVTRAVGGARARKEEALGTAKHDGHEIAEAVLSWRPLRPPGGFVYEEYTEKDGTKWIRGTAALPAGPDGGRSLFAGRTFKIRDAVHPRDGAEK